MITTLRVGIGSDTHRTIENRPLILGGVTIPCDFGLEGHSDADVLLHAISDALLGATGQGDIGAWFPDTDPNWKNVDSKTLLLKILQTLSEQHWQIINLDCTIHAQRPKLSQHKQQIRESLAHLLTLEETQINVKAKTGEQVGPIGRGEALAADAVVLVARQNQASG